MKTSLRAVGVAAAMLGLGAVTMACQASSPPLVPVPTPTVAPTVTVVETRTADPVSPWEDSGSSDPLTDLVVQLSWNEQAEGDKRAMCTSMSYFGVDWAARQLRAGAESSSYDASGIDWDRAAEWVKERCRVEGY